MRRTRKRPPTAQPNSPAPAKRRWTPGAANSRLGSGAPAAPSAEAGTAGDDPPPARRNGHPAADSVKIPKRTAPPHAMMPTAPVRALLSAAVVLHLLAVGVSLLSVIEPSETQDRLLSFFRPYLQATHFGLDDRPLYLADGAPSERAYRLQIADTAEPAESDWRTIEPAGWPGLAASDRQHRWLATAVMLAESEQPSLAAELLLPVARQQGSAEAIRIQRLAATWRIGSAEAEPVPYAAQVVRAGDRVGLVQLQDPRLSATATPAISEADDE